MHIPATTRLPVTGFGIPGPFPPPALYGGQHSACSGALQGPQHARARGKACDGTQGYDGHSVTDSTFPMPLVAQLAAGFGSLAVRSIRNAAEWTLDTWCATVDAHPGWRRRACPGRIQSSGGLWRPRTEARLQPGAGPRST